MRRSGGTEWGINKNGMWSILLKANYCAEHEGGLKYLKNWFGIGKVEDVRRLLFGLISVQVNDAGTKLGIERRKISRLPVGFVKFETKFKGKKWVGLGLGLDVEEGQVVSWKSLPSELYFGEKDDLVSAWSDRSFIILGCGRENINRINNLYDAFKRHDVAMWMGSSQVFSSGGFIIAIPSLMDEELNKQLTEADYWSDKLSEAVDKTGIVNRLKKAEKNYFALVPTWNDDEKTEIKFFLNPHDQHIYKSGWFTLKDLEDWIQGIGKIVK